MKSNATIQLAKRDGTREPFQAAKLRRCFAIGMNACGYEEHLADDLVRAVWLHLKEWPESRPPKTEYVFRCVRTVLKETGLRDVAKFLDRYRRERAGRRSQVRVALDRRAESPPRAWQKGHVVRALQKRFGLARTTARVLGNEVEQRVLGLGYRLVSSSLITELVRNELRCWGLARGALRVGSDARFGVVTPAED